MAHTGESAVAGKTSGLIGLGEEVTWRARHFGVTHEHCSRITAYDRPRHFRDSMVRGRFKVFEHDHFFEPAALGQTRMRDVLVFHSPFGIFGRAVDNFVMARYLRGLLERRNEVIRVAAESDELKVQQPSWQCPTMR
jgi:ligand-binding SRPBCC domain-containing protein